MHPVESRHAVGVATVLFSIVLTIGLAIGLASAPARAADGSDDFVQHAAHEHGRATLDVAVDAGTVTMRLSAPAMDVVGFEHAPRTDAQREAAESANALLRQHRTLFAFPVAARCTFGGADVTPPSWAGHGHDHDHDHAGGSSASGSSASGPSAHEGAHADYVAQWRFTCAAPAALAFVDVRLAERLRRDLVVVANVITDAVQTRQELRAGATRVKLR